LFVFLIALVGAAQATAALPAEDPNDPVICHRQQSEVGTHMAPKKICLRRSDWDLIEKNTQRELQNLQDKHLDPGRTDGHGPGLR
jgi:hypothetical protein